MRYRKNEKKDDVLAFRALGAILTILNLKKTLYIYIYIYIKYIIYLIHIKLVIFLQ
jgi:hypothetical protein